MLAKEASSAFDDKDWVFEIKWDGYRAIAELNGGEVNLYSRNGNTFNASYPLLTQELKKLKLTATLDGEIVALNKNGDPDFQILQDFGNGQQYPMHYYVFDLLSYNNKNLCELPLLERKQLLKKIIKKNEVIKYSDHFPEKGISFFNATKRHKLEGIIAKKSDSEYFAGKRTNNWLKIKHHKTADAVIAGFTKPAGSRNFFGALVLGVWEGDTLKYVGHVGSGFNAASLKKMNTLLHPLIQKKSPFSETVKTNNPVTWVKPLLVCEVKYTAFTNKGQFRHPIFLRWRDDKKTKDATMENSETSAKKKVRQKKEKVKKVVNTEKNSVISFGKIKLNVTNLNKVFWPDEQITKGDVLNYYSNIAEYILPYLKGRPQSLKRNPNGINDKGFFHKDAAGDAPAWVDRIKLFSDSAKKDINYILCNNKATLAYLNNLGCIEINPWHSTIKALDKPDYLVLDIDPSDKNTFEEVIETANVMHELLEKAGAVNFCKTSGATGLHIYIPTEKKYNYEQIKDFAEIICVLANAQLPAFTSLERNLKKRGNKIYLDHLQNRRGQTIAAAYCLRPYEGATVSTPLEWKEVKQGLSPAQFTLNTLPLRLKKKGDLFSGILGKGIDIKKCLAKLGQ
ncbi:MAG: DNA ligase D [Bacteroidia bacterium]|nr:DNA ligase D [Bacteroidia bacterium]